MRRTTFEGLMMISERLRTGVAVAVLMVLIGVLPAYIAQGEEGHGDDDHSEEGHSNEERGEEGLTLSEDERKKAGIVLQTITKQAVSKPIRVPGEVQANAYKTAKIAPRIAAQVVTRHATLGQHVEQGQPLVMLSSVEMADAQGELIVADQEWKRVQSLGKEVLSGRRYTEAEVNRQRAMARVLAYGMSRREVSKLLDTKDASLATGEFSIVAPLDGTILLEDFVIGELIEPGHVLFEISDETSLWVEARVSGETIGSIDQQTAVRISPDQKTWRDAAVIQISHQLNRATRTQAVRIEFGNEDDWLHAGQFVDVELSTPGSEEKLAVPAEAIVLLKGESIVFKLEDDGEIHPQEVKVGRSFGDDMEILSGISEGEQIAIRGAFNLKSLLLKSELGEGHAH